MTGTGRSQSRSPSVPDSMDSAWVRNPIDAFISEVHNVEKLAHAPEADRGPDPPAVVRPDRPAAAAEEVDAFVEDTARTRTRSVDRLLASPHFGGRMALFWLDWCGFADTGGYHSDNHRDVCAVPRLRHRRLQRQQALRPLHRASSWPATCCPTPRRSRRSPPATTGCSMTTEEGGAQAEGVHRQVRGRPRPQRLDRLARPDARLRRVPRPQVRPVSPRRTSTASPPSSPTSRRSPSAGSRRRRCPRPSRPALAAPRRRIAPVAQDRSTRPTPELDAGAGEWESDEGAKPRRQVGTRRLDEPRRADSSRRTPCSTVQDDRQCWHRQSPAKDTYTVTLKTDRGGHHRASAWRPCPTTLSPSGGPGCAANGNFVLTGSRSRSPARRQAPVKLAAADADFAQNGYPRATALLTAAEGRGWAHAHVRRRNDPPARVRLRRAGRRGAPWNLLTYAAHQNYGPAATTRPLPL